MSDATTILLIDARKEDRQYWAQRLNIACPEYVVLEADTGTTGLAIYRSQRVDCIVTELELPDMSGFSVLIDMVCHPTNPERAVIFLTRLSYRTLDELARKNGASSYLVKSHASGDLLHLAIRNALTAVAHRAENNRKGSSV